MGWSAWVSLTLWWAPVPSVSFEAGPAAHSVVGDRRADVEPLTLTWTPEEGFGASSSMSVGRYWYPE